MKHILFIDPLAKLSFKKDSTLMLAVSMKKRGLDVRLLFEEDFYLSNKVKPRLLLYDFSGDFYDDGAYLKRFELGAPQEVELVEKDTIHMRIDPPFDTRYLRYLWMLRYYLSKGIRVLNSPDGILKYNEKLHAYSQSASLASYVGSSRLGFESFVATMRKNHQYLVMKPLDLYQGMGVEKVAVDDPHLLEKFEAKVQGHSGAIVVQPYVKEVEDGEIRAIYFKGRELGSILKIPRKGEFLANIAQGAAFHAEKLSAPLAHECARICQGLAREGVDWVAFDILGDRVSEINITCPGLLVEVSFAHQKNLADEIIDMLS